VTFEESFRDVGKELDRLMEALTVLVSLVPDAVLAAFMASRGYGEDEIKEQLKKMKASREQK